MPPYDRAWEPGLLVNDQAWEPDILDNFSRNVLDRELYPDPL